jgi:catabolite regulation protein CreA
MKKSIFLCILFAILSSNVNAQMISVTGGNLNLHGNNKGYIEVEAMLDITKNVAAHISYTKTIGLKFPIFNNHNNH